MSREYKTGDLGKGHGFKGVVGVGDIIEMVLRILVADTYRSR